MGKFVTLQHASVDANRPLTTKGSIQGFKCMLNAHHQCRRTNKCSANTPVRHDFLFLTLPAFEPFWSSSDLSSASPVTSEKMSRYLSTRDIMRLTYSFRQYIGTASCCCIHLR